MQKYFDDFTAFWRNFFAFQHVDIFHRFCGIMGSIFQIWMELWVINLNLNGTSPSRT